MNNDDTSLLNFRIPNELKHEFRLICTRNRSRMTTELVRMIRDFVNNETVEKEALDVAKKTAQKRDRSESQGGYVKNPYTGVWENPIMRG